MAGQCEDQSNGCKRQCLLGEKHLHMVTDCNHQQGSSLTSDGAANNKLSPRGDQAKCGASNVSAEDSIQGAASAETEHTTRERYNDNNVDGIKTPIPPFIHMGHERYDDDNDVSVANHGCCFPVVDTDEAFLRFHGGRVVYN